MENVKADRLYGTVPTGQPEQAPHAREHRLQLTDRHTLVISGVEDVTAYDAYSATLETSCGTLIVGGNEIRVKNFSAESGEARIEGEIEYLQYQGKKKSEKSEGLFKRLMR